MMSLSLVLEKSRLVSVYVCEHLNVYTTFFTLRHSLCLNELELLFCSIWNFSWCYAGCRSVNVMFSLHPDELGVSDTSSYEVQRRERGSMEQRVTQRREDKSVDEEMRKMNLMMLGPGSSTYLSVSIMIHFLCVFL